MVPRGGGDAGVCERRLRGGRGHHPSSWAPLSGGENSGSGVHEAPQGAGLP